MVLLWCYCGDGHIVNVIMVMVLHMWSWSCCYCGDGHVVTLVMVMLFLWSWSWCYCGDGHIVNVIMVMVLHMWSVQYPVLCVLILCGFSSIPCSVCLFNGVFPVSPCFLVGLRCVAQYAHTCLQPYTVWLILCGLSSMPTLLCWLTLCAHSVWSLQYPLLCVFI